MLLFIPAMLFGFLTGGLLAFFFGGRGAIGWGLFLCIVYIWLTLEEYSGTGYSPADYSPTGTPSGWGDLMLEQLPGWIIGICLSVGAAYALVNSSKKLPHQRRNNDHH